MAGWRHQVHYHSVGLVRYIWRKKWEANCRIMHLIFFEAPGPPYFFFFSRHSPSGLYGNDITVVHKLVSGVVNFFFFFLNGCATVGTFRLPPRSFWSFCFSPWWTIWRCLGAPRWDFCHCFHRLFCYSQTVLPPNPPSSPAGIRGAHSKRRQKQKLGGSLAGLPWCLRLGFRCGIVLSSRSRSPKTKAQLPTAWHSKEVEDGFFFFSIS